MFQADEDLYGDLSGLQQDAQPANATAAGADTLVPSTAPKEEPNQPTETIAQPPDRQDPVAAPGGERQGTPEVGAPEDEGLPEDLSAADAFSKIAEAVGKSSESPRDVVLAVAALASQADANKRRTTEQHQQHIAQQIQVLSSSLNNPYTSWRILQIPIGTESISHVSTDIKLDGDGVAGKEGGSRGQGRGPS